METWLRRFFGDTVTIFSYARSDVEGLGHLNIPVDDRGRDLHYFSTVERDGAGAGAVWRCAGYDDRPNARNESFLTCQPIDGLGSKA